MNSDITKYTFSGHDSFQCRHLWLKKGFDFVQEGLSFNSEDAVVKLGVGKNMVSSIRYWMKAFNIIDTKDKITEFGGKFFNDKNGYDPYLENDASLWLLHYQLIKTGFASIYSIIFNDFRREKIYFNKDSFLNYLKRKRETDQSLSFNENTVADDFVVFIKMYQRSESTKDVEDKFSGILSDIELLTTTGYGKDEQYQIENNSREKLPEAILLFSILDNESLGSSISLNALEYENNSPGSIFALDRAGLINKISDILRVYKNITFNDHAGIKEVQFKYKQNPYSILDNYYGQ